MAPEVPDVEIPAWVTEIDGSKVRDLVAVAGTLTAIGSDPLGWFEDNVVEVILARIVEGMLQIGGMLASTIAQAYGQVARVPVLLADPLGDAGGTLLEAVEALFMALNEGLVSVASATGPFAPLVVMLLWLVVLAVVIRLLEGLISTIRVVNPW